MNRDSLTQARVKELLRYSSKTGVLTWRQTRGRINAGDTVASLRGDGYLQVGIDGHRYMAHRIIWLYKTGGWPPRLIDHKDGVRTNNAWKNLRSASPVMNSQNLRGAHSDNTHGLLGVSFISGRKLRPYRAEIRYLGRALHLGTFSTPEEAYQVYLKAKRELHKGNTL